MSSRTGSVHAVRVLGAAGADRFVDMFDTAVAIEGGTSLPMLLRSAVTPIDLSPGGPLHALLPAPDREWLRRHDVALAAPILDRDEHLGRRSSSPRRRPASPPMVAIAASWHRPRVPPPRRWTRWPPPRVTRRRRRHAEPGSTARPPKTTRHSNALSAVSSRTIGCCLAPVTASRCWRRCHAACTADFWSTAASAPVAWASSTWRATHDSVATSRSRRCRRSAQGTMARLRDEARAMAVLNHDALATIYGLEIWHRTPVLVVEYLGGGTLAARVAHAPLSVAATLDLGVALARALVDMHGQGLVHRDLKPSNIGFTSGGAPKLLDFGLATWAADRDGPSGLGRRGRCSGTPAYLPPEAWTGASVSPAFDLWALALVLLEAVTGARGKDRGLSLLGEANPDSPRSSPWRWRSRRAADSRQRRRCWPISVS